MEEGKTREMSENVMSELVLPNDTNVIGNLLGGRLLHWIDIAGALTATRHSESIVATLTMDTVQFKHPVKMGNIVILKSYMTWTGKSSMETVVEVYAEDPYKNEKHIINRIYIVFAAIDENGNKKDVIPYIPVTDDEIKEFESGFERKEQRLKILREDTKHYWN